MILDILLWCLFGLVAGAVAQFLMPGRDPGQSFDFPGFLITTVLGIAGAMVGGLIGNAIGFRGESLLDWRSLVLAVGGALLLLLAYRAFRLLFGDAESSAASIGTRAAHRGSRTGQYAYDAATTPNLTEIATKAVTPDVVQKLSGTVGESPSNTRKAMEAMIPAVLAGAASQASTSSGAARLFDMAKESAVDSPDLIGNLASHLTGGGIENMGRTGQGILSAIFGDKLGSLLSWFGKFAGIKSASVSSLMGVAANLVMNVLGKQILQNGLSASSLSSLLGGQKGWLSRLLPSGLTNVPGLSALADYGEQAGAAVRGAAEEYGERVGEYGERIGTAAREGYRGTVGAGRAAVPWVNALLPLFLLGLPLLAFPFLARGCASRAPQVARTTPPRTTESREPVVKAPEVRVPDTGIKPAEFQFLLPGVKSVPIKLPDGVNLSIPETSFLNGAYKFLAEAGDTKSRTFVFEHLNFDGAAIKTAPETETSVKVVSALLKAFPNVQLRVEGHTDNVGDATAHRRISQERADAVKEMLVKAGVPADRIRTEGHGSEKPIAPNDTEENRAKNRRIELVVVKK